MDRRRYIRYQEQHQVLIMHNDAVIEGKTMDISHDGIGLILSQNLQNLSDFPVSISLPIGRQEMTADICWSKSINHHEHIIGLHLNSAPVEYLNYAATIKYKENLT